MNTVLKRYKLVLVPLALVLFFDLSLLITNYYISSKLEIASININIAGRQRMLSQRMTKSLALVHFKLGQDVGFEQDRLEMEQAVSLFDQTLNAFHNGGKATSAAGEVIYVDKLTRTELQSTLDKATEIWLPTHRKLEAFLTLEVIGYSETEYLIDMLAVINLQLLTLMNDLTNQLEHDATQKTYFLKGLQTAVVIMILLSFLIATLRLYRREHYYDNLMEKSTDIVLGIDIQTGNTTFVSSSIHQVLGYEGDRLIGKPASNVFTEGSKNIFSDILDTIARTGQLENERCEIGLIKHNGEILIADMVMQLTVSEDGKSTELSADIRDISERKAAELVLSELAHKDELTGLPNRKLFLDLTEHSLGRASRNSSRFGIMFIDLDGFKAVNDNFGHDIGDKLLINIAGRLTSIFRASDYVARIGGDEFIALVEDVHGKSQIQNLAEKVIQEISQSMFIEGHDVKVGASIGVAIFPEDGDKISDLMVNADKAMYKVKKSGKNAAAFSSQANILSSNDHQH